MNTRFLLPCYHSWQEWLVSLFHSLFWSFPRIALSRITQQQGSSRSTNCCSFIQDDFLKIFSCQPRVGIVLGRGLFVLSSCWSASWKFWRWSSRERDLPTRQALTTTLSLLLDYCNYSVRALRLCHHAVFARWQRHRVRMKSLQSCRVGLSPREATSRRLYTVYAILSWLCDYEVTQRLLSLHHAEYTCMVMAHGVVWASYFMAFGFMSKEWTSSNFRVSLTKVSYRLTIWESPQVSTVLAESSEEGTIVECFIMSFGWKLLDSSAFLGARD
jgi:hypothetical protein